MSLGRLVPWESWEEWRQVGEWLLSQEEHDVQRGIQRVAAWRARGRLPLGVDITACLVETRARDPLAAPQQAQQAQQLPDSQLRLQYAMALVRMVNGIADSSQKGRVAVSVASLAAAAGLPRMLVDLRHESTHNELPSAASLRLAAAQALVWLQSNYWQRQADHLAGCREKVAELVQEYVSLHAAAAAKVAAHAEAAGEELIGAAAATAAAAVVAGGRKAAAAAAGAPAAAAGRAGAASPGGAAAAAPGSSAKAEPREAEGGYTAAEGQRRRRALFSELKMGVPRPAASLLVAPLLQAGASEEVLAAAGGDPAARERALATALPHFSKEWPQLPGLLLRAAVERLAACAARGGGGSSSSSSNSGSAGGSREQALAEQGELAGDAAAPLALPPEACLAWVGRLLPPPLAAPGAKQAAAPKTAGGVVPGWAPSAALLQELAGLCLPALLACTHHAWLAWIESGSGASADGAGQQQEPVAGSAAAAGAALQATLRLLLDSWRAAGGSPAALSRCVALAAQAQLPGQQQQQQAQQPRRGGAQGSATRPQQAAAVGSLAGEEAGKGGALEALSQQLQRAAGGLQGLRQKRAAEPMAAGGAAKRWRRAFGWAPCALGSLPSASDPNGRPAPRDLPPPPAHGNVEGRDTLEQRLVAAPEAQATAALPAAARQEAQDTGAEDVLVPAGEAWAAEQAEAAGVEEAGQAEWPLPDGRLAWALAAAAAGHEGGVEAEQGAGAAAEAPRRVSFPPLQLLL